MYNQIILDYFVVKKMATLVGRKVNMFTKYAAKTPPLPQQTELEHYLNIYDTF